MEDSSLTQFEDYGAGEDAVMIVLNAAEMSRPETDHDSKASVVTSCPIDVELEQLED